MVFSFDEVMMICLAMMVSIAGFQDLRFQRIPNLITYPTIVAALLFHSVIDGFSGFLFSLGGLSVGLGIGIVPYIMGGVGAGDAKLIGAIGASVGAKALIIVILFSALAGGAYIIVLAFTRWRYFGCIIGGVVRSLWILATTGQFFSFSDSDSEQYNKPKLYYGIPIALGTFAYVLTHFLQPAPLW
jgi:prepilin peptidase CpaA